MAFANIKNQLQSALKDRVSNALGDLGISRVPKRNSITEFIGSLNRSGGMARANKYEVEILAHRDHPGGMQNRIVNLHCNTITMPGHDLEQQTQRLGSEPATEIVQGHEYAGNITATFYLDASLETKSWFDAWQEMSFDRATHKAKYYEDYIGTMNIYQLGADGSRTYGIQCEEVYPATIGGIEYAYESTDTIALLSVEFAYKRWTDIQDTVSGVPFKDLVEEFLGYSTERLPGNGVQQVDRPYMFDKSRIFK